MYIPTIFFNQAGGCIQPFISGSTIESPNYYMGKITSGSQTYFYIDIAANVTASFTIASGISANAKLLLIGGGGASMLYQDNPSGPGSNSAGGAAGNVFFDDIPLEPGSYEMKAGRGGYSSSVPATSDGTNSSFRRLQSSLEEYGYLGEEGNNLVGGNNTYYTGATGVSGTGGNGGGGAGSTTNAEGANGGSGSFIPSPWNSILQNSSAGIGNVAGGGNGEFYNGNHGISQFPLAYGSGGPGENAPNSGQDGRAIIYIPIGNCYEEPTGSLILPTTESFQATGGDIVGTFASASVYYKYHLFYETGSTQYFRVTNASTEEAKILIVGGGAGGTENFEENGGSGAGKVAITRNITLYGIYGASVGVGGTSTNTGGTSVFQSLSNFTDHYAANGGGVGARRFIADGQNGGSGGGGGFQYNGSSWVTLQRGLAIDPSSSGEPYNVADEYYGSDGSNGSVVGGIGVGGGGGGATGTGGVTGSGGPGYTLTDEFFPASVLFTTTSIARGGDGGLLNTHNIQASSGDGGKKNGAGANGFICITYPISGSIGNSSFTPTCSYYRFTPGSGTQTATYFACNATASVSVPITASIDVCIYNEYDRGITGGGSSITLLSASCP